MRIGASVCIALLSLVALDPCTINGREASDPRSTIAPVDDNIIHLSVLVAAAPAEAYGYFTDNELLQSWLAAVADVEPRIGGKYELFWLPEDRENNSTIGCRVTALSPDQLIAFQWRSPKQFKPFANSADPLTHVVVAFVQEDTGTRIHIVHSGWRSSDEWEEARSWQEKAWINALRRLDQALTK